MAAWNEGGESFKERIAGDSRVQRIMSQEEVNGCFDLEYNLRHIDRIFERTLGLDRAKEIQKA